MNLENLLLKVENGIGILSVNRPKVLNALDSQVLKEISMAMDEIAQDDSIRVLVITGEGKSFVAGADIEEMSVLNAVEGAVFGEVGMTAMRKVELLPKPVIAAVNGFALGGGCELALACDIRIASSKAKFGQPEVGLGITPGFSGTQRLPRVVGAAKAKELIFTGEIIDAKKALEIGLVNDVVEPEELMDKVLELAGKIAKNSKSAVSMAKEAINRGIETDIETGINIEKNLFGLCFSTADQKEGMKAFLEKRPPQFG
ncbi:MAG: hypothetical protein GXZ11_09230 [Tissierellia bacterium]|nr:hypothetical protein [Tissierellia bacterium]